MIMVKNMNKKGFTLIELLAVIALLAILAMIAVPTVDNALNSSRKSLNKVQEGQIIKGAKEFFADNLYCLPGNDDSRCNFDGVVKESDNVKVTLSCLKNTGYLPANIVNIEKKKAYSNENYVKVTKDGNQYKYEVVVAG